MKLLFLFVFNPLLFATIEVGGVHFDSCYSFSLIKKTLVGSAYQNDDDGVVLVMRKLKAPAEVKELILKIEKNFPSLEFHRIRMNSGKTLLAGVFSDPFLHDWVFICRAIQQFKKRVLVVVAIQESRTKLDYFHFLDRLTIHAV
jgi:hypothetical protein